MNVGELLAKLVGLDHLTEVVIYDDDVLGSAVLFPFRAGPDRDPEGDPVFVIHSCPGSHGTAEYDHEDQAPD